MVPQAFNIWDAAWIAGTSLNAWCNGRQFMSDTNPNTVWTDPIGWVKQTGFPSTPNVGDIGLNETDWVVAYTYVGP